MDERLLSDWSAAGPSWERLADALAAAGVGAGDPVAALRVPGRVELFGKHTDYAGGSSLVTAIDRGFTLLVSVGGPPRLEWRDVGRGLVARVDLRRPEARPGDWSNYLRIPARRRLADCGPPRRGLRVAMTSDLPAAAGLSSSSALVVAAYLALAAADPAPAAPGLDDRLRLAAYLGAVENGAPFDGLDGGEGVGTAGGSEDHAAILCSRAGEVARFGYCPLRLERRLPWPADWRLVIGVCGVRAEKSGAALGPYNRLSMLAGEATAAWRRASGGAAVTLGEALAAVGAEDLERDLAAACPGPEGDPVRRRARHFVIESTEVLPAAVDALARADAPALGRAAQRSQAAAERWLGNQVAETIALSRLALEQGALAASAFGAGFGGAVWAVVSAGDARSFIERWQAIYERALPRDRGARFFAVAPAGGARWLSRGDRLGGGSAASGLATEDPA